MKHEALIAIDPGNRSGYAVLTIESEPRLLFSGTVDVTKAGVQHSPSHVLEFAQRHTLDKHGYSLTMGVVEDQFVGKNPATSIKIGRNSGRWEEACRRLFMDVTFIKPASWQHAQLKGLLPKGRGVKSVHRKRAAAQFVQIAYGRKLAQDAADAAVMGRYAAINQTQQSLFRRSK